MIGNGIGNLSDTEGSGEEDGRNGPADNVKDEQGYATDVKVPTDLTM